METKELAPGKSGFNWDGLFNNLGGMFTGIADIVGSALGAPSNKTPDNSGSSQEVVLPAKKNNTNAWLIGIGIVLVIGVGAYFLLQKK